MFRCYFKYFKNVRKVKLQLSRQKKNVAMYRDIYNYIDINAMISCELKNYRKFLFFRLTEKWLRLKSGIPPDKNDTEQLLQRKCFLSHVLCSKYSKTFQGWLWSEKYSNNPPNVGVERLFSCSKMYRHYFFFNLGKKADPLQPNVSYAFCTLLKVVLSHLGEF